MTPLSEEILSKWQVRKTKKQKAAFIEFLMERLPGLQVEQSRFPKSRNLVLGDVKNAKVILTAHYDTCAKLPFPNMITPLNAFWYIGYQLLVCALFLPFYLVPMVLLRVLGMEIALSSLLSLYGMLFAMVWVTMLGKPNPHTANDNTSGVITLCEIWAALTPQEREQVAFVFFDNEENGLLGSLAFASRHRRDGIKKKLLLNFDCVSDGDFILLALNKKTDKRYGQLLADCYAPSGGKTVLKRTSAIYPSDQANFPLGVGVAALKKHRILGYYMDKIHTTRDVEFDRRNIALLTNATKRLVAGMGASEP